MIARNHSQRKPIVNRKLFDLNSKNYPNNSLNFPNNLANFYYCLVKCLVFFSSSVWNSNRLIFPLFRNLIEFAEYSTFFHHFNIRKKKVFWVVPVRRFKHCWSFRWLVGSEQLSRLPAVFNWKQKQKKILYESWPQIFNLSKDWL